MASAALAVALYDAFGEVDHWAWGARLWPAGAALALCFAGVHGRLDAIGLRVRPLPSAGYWLRAVVWLAVLFGAILAVWFAVLVVLDEPLASQRVHTLADVWDTCVYAPIVEETIYRWALVTGLVALVPRWAAVLVSGLVFAYIHKDVAAANNLSAGFVFAWMYLRSSSIAMPIAFHALGNLSVIVANTIMFELA
jgi:membrane protease YdiL (CAAX protease family)